MKTVLNKCPVCGSRITFNVYYQFTRDYLVKKNGTPAKKCRKSGECPLECSNLSCTKCDWCTSVDYEVMPSPNVPPEVRMMNIECVSEGGILRFLKDGPKVGGDNYE